MTAIKGYVVRGRDNYGIAVTPTLGTGTREFELHITGALDEGETYSTADAALGAMAEMVREFEVSDVAIFRVHDDDTEEQLPSYEEALALLGGDPLAALEAAERRLLEADGWRQIEPDAYGGEQWQHPKHGRECRMVALTIARKAGVK